MYHVQGPVDEVRERKARWRSRPMQRFGWWYMYLFIGTVQHEVSKLWLDIFGGAEELPLASLMCVLIYRRSSTLSEEIRR